MKEQEKFYNYALYFYLLYQHFQETLHLVL